MFLWELGHTHGEAPEAAVIPCVVESFRMAPQRWLAHRATEDLPCRSADPPRH